MTLRVRQNLTEKVARELCRQDDGISVTDEKEWDKIIPYFKAKYRRDAARIIKMVIGGME